METRIFRSLLIGSLALTTLANTFDLLFPSFISPTHQAAVLEQAKLGLGDNSGLWIGFFVFCFDATIVSAIGLWRGERWGAWLGAAITALGFLAMPVLGSYVLSGVALSIGQIAVGLWFVVLAAAFTSRPSQLGTLKAA